MSSVNYPGILLFLYLAYVSVLSVYCKFFEGRDFDNDCKQEVLSARWRARCSLPQKHNKTNKQQQQTDESSSRKVLYHNKGQQKSCEAKSLRITAQKNMGNILPASPFTPIQSSSAPRVIPWRYFIPCKPHCHGCLQPLLLKTPTVFTNTKPS